MEVMEEGFQVDSEYGVRGRDRSCRRISHCICIYFVGFSAFIFVVFVILMIKK